MWYYVDDNIDDTAFFSKWLDFHLNKQWLFELPYKTVFVFQNVGTNITNSIDSKCFSYFINLVLTQHWMECLMLSINNLQWHLAQMKISFILYDPNLYYFFFQILSCSFVCLFFR